MKTIRKILIAMLLAIAVPCWAQPPPRIAWVWPGTPEGTAVVLAAFKAGMRENGMIEGRHYILDERYADGKYELFPALTEELLKRNPAILMVNTIASVRAAQQATRTVPIIFVNTNDPVGSGLVVSLSHPGGNTTGLSTQNEDASNKYIELLRELLPGVSRIAVLSNPDNLSCPKIFERFRVVAASFGITARAFDVTTPAGLDAVFKEIAQYRPHALLVLPDAMFYDQRVLISKFSTSQRIPAIAAQSGFVASGCLISFGPNRPDVFRRSAIYVKKILGGAKPADLPVEQPTKFEIVVNSKTAKALGITIPQSVLLRAAEVIQ
ncbi:MAG: ABC transporter substrate-binding protein [Nitrospirae bacterium]|nr:ABC transporter substrate-binding protein [Nitrospirota bacterium]